MCSFRYQRLYSPGIQLTHWPGMSNTQKYSAREQDLPLRVNEQRPRTRSCHEWERLVDYPFRSTGGARRRSCHAPTGSDHGPEGPQWGSVIPKIEGDASTSTVEWCTLPPQMWQSTRKRVTDSDARRPCQWNSGAKDDVTVRVKDGGEAVSEHKLLWGGYD